MIKVVGAGRFPPVMMYEEIPRLDEHQESVARRAKFLENVAWAVAHGTEIHRDCRGKFICVAGGELFVADSPRESHAMAHAAHPSEVGASFSTYIPDKLQPKIYAD